MIKKGPTTVGNLHRETSRGPGKRYVGRGSVFGNPCKMATPGDRNKAILGFLDHLEKNPMLVALAPQLRGEHLLCYCHPLPCHAHVWKMLADGNEFSIVCEYVREKLG